jgi:hypothetical protein
MNSEEVLFALECYIVAKSPNAVDVKILMDMNTGDVDADFDIPYQCDDDDECDGNCKKCDHTEDCEDDKEPVDEEGSEELISKNQFKLLSDAIIGRVQGCKTKSYGYSVIIQDVLTELGVNSLRDVKKYDYDRALDIIKSWKGGDKKIEI